jgi:hypothetical protein
MTYISTPYLRVLKCDAGKDMEISWTDHVINKEVLQRVKDEINVPNKMQWRKANWFGHMLLRNCLLEHVTEGKIEVKVGTGRRGRKHKLLLHDLEETRRYWKQKEETLHRKR